MYIIKSKSMEIVAWHQTRVSPSFWATTYDEMSSFEDKFRTKFCQKFRKGGGTDETQLSH